MYMSTWVGHGLLLDKLNAFSISENTYMLIKSYLSSRQQQVKIGNKLATTFIGSSGVAQGRNLVPFLFQIFVNKLPRHIQNSGSFLFADDQIFFIILK